MDQNRLFSVHTHTHTDTKFLLCFSVSVLNLILKCYAFKPFAAENNDEKPKENPHIQLKIQNAHSTGKSFLFRGTSNLKYQFTVERKLAGDSANALANASTSL